VKSGGVKTFLWGGFLASA